MHLHKKWCFLPLVVCTLLLVLSTLPSGGMTGEERKLSFYNTHTNEHLEIIYKKGEDYNPQALQKINHIFRDHRADKSHPIDPALLDYLYDLLKKVDYLGEVHIISG